MSTNHQICNGTLNSNEVKSKLPQLISEISKSKCNIIFMQEIHHVENYHFLEIERRCKGNFFVNRGTLHSAGVCIFIKNTEELKILGNVHWDDQGRFIKVGVTINGVELTIVSIYCPPNCRYRILFLQRLVELLEGERNILLLGTSIV